MQGRAESADAMKALGAAAASQLAPGSVVALTGGLGAGKTHWTKGLVAGLGSAAEVTSPTFSLIHEYPGGRVPVIHLDLYRLESPEELIALGWDESLEADAIVVAEWADKFPELFPPSTIWLQFAVEPDQSRTVTRMLP